MSESGELVRELLGMGLSRRAIGQAVGRNDRLIGYVEKDVKPGENLRDSLRELRDRLAGGAPREQAVTAVPAPARRTTRAGTLAGTRRAATRKGARWQNSTAKRQAVRSGGKSLLHPLADAADDGRTVAVTVSFDRGLNVRSAYGKRGRAGAGGAVDMELGDAADVWDQVDQLHGGNFAEYVASEARARGLIAEADETAVAHMTAMELRGW